MKPIAGRVHDLGGGLKVRRLLPDVSQQMVGPFIFLDHIGPFESTPDQNTDVRPHPHIGLSTLTYLFEGRIVHRDSLGEVATIEPGQVNWMTAGRGISHSERAHEGDRGRARRLHGLQFWVALADGQEQVPPSFQHYTTVPRFSDQGLSVTLVAGSVFGQTSPVVTSSPLLFAEFKSLGDGPAPLHFSDQDLPGGFESAVYVISGSVRVGTKDGLEVSELSFAYFEPGELKQLQVSRDTHFILIAGEPFKTERHIWWNLVSSSKERIELAKSAWRERTFPMVPGETERIEVPKD